MKSTHPGTAAALRGSALATPTRRTTGTPGIAGMTALAGVLGLALGLGACANAHSTGSPCLDKCHSRSMTSLERSTCELECTQTARAPASAPAPAVTTIPDQPGQSVPSDPQAQPQPAQPAGPKQYAGDTGQRQAPAGSTAPPSKVPPPGWTPPATQANANMAALQQQRAACESTCDANNASNTDRATCRLRCAQITDKPTPPPPSSGANPVYVNPPTTPPTQGTTQPAPVDRAAIAACEANCNANARPTDRATCRLNCNAVGSVGPTPTSYAVLQGTPTGTNRADVIRSSGGVAGTTPPASVANPDRVAQCATQAQQCTTTCNARTEPCNRGCNEGKMSATDRATCKLTCENTIDTCRDDCRIKEGTCRGPAPQR